MAHGFRESAKLRDFGRDKRAFYGERCKRQTVVCLTKEKKGVLEWDVFLIDLGKTDSKSMVSFFIMKNKKMFSFIKGRFEDVIIIDGYIKKKLKEKKYSNQICFFFFHIIFFSI